MDCRFAGILPTDNGGDTDILFTENDFEHAYKQTAIGSDLLGAINELKFT